MKTKLTSLFISLIMLLLVTPGKVNADNGIIDNNSGQTNTTITFTPNDSKPDTNGNGESNGNNSGDSNNNGSDINHGTDNGEDIPGNGNNGETIDPLLPNNQGNINSNPPIQQNYANGIGPNGALPQTNEASTSIVFALGIIMLLAGVVINKYANERGKKSYED